MVPLRVIRRWCWESRTCLNLRTSGRDQERYRNNLRTMALWAHLD